MNDETKAPEEQKPDIKEVIKAKAEELSKREGVKVHPILFYLNGNESDPVIGYIKEPSRLAKIRILDKGEQIGSNTAAAEMLDMCLLDKDSDQRITNPSQEYDSVYLGAAFECQKIIQFAINQIKKN